VPNVPLAVLLGIGLGLLLILAIARFGPPVEQHADHASGAPELPAEELETLVRALAAGLGLEVVLLARGTDGIVEATLRDPRPLAGGRLLLRATPVLSRGKLDAPAVLELADAVRADASAGKGVLIALAGFTDEARSAAAAAPAALELYDGPALLTLCRDVVPERAEALRVYRGVT
jgi:restriction system protein